MSSGNNNNSHREIKVKEEACNRTGNFSIDDDSDTESLTSSLRSIGETEVKKGGNLKEDDFNVQCPIWSEILASPTNGYLFSPSRRITENDSIHGKGLSVAAVHLQTLSETGKKCAAMISEISTLHENYALAILKCCESISSPGSSSQNVLSCYDDDSVLIREVNRCLISFAKQTQGLAICVRGSVARPLHVASCGTLDAASNIHNQYIMSRTKCLKSRATSNKIRTRYIKSVKETEYVLSDLKRIKESKSQSSKGKKIEEGKIVASLKGERTYDHSSQSHIISVRTEPTLSEEKTDRKIKHNDEVEKNKLVDKNRVSKWKAIGQKIMKHGVLSKSLENAISLLNTVQDCENQYCKSVKEENNAVSRSQNMEKNGLEGLQQLEHERVNFFFETMQRFLQAEKGALDNMSLVMNMENVFYSKPNETSCINGVKEALSLDLPKEIGELRDNQTIHILEKEKQSSFLKLSTVFLGDIELASDAFVSSLQDLLSEKGYLSQVVDHSSIYNMLQKNEGSRLLTCWNKVVKMLEECSLSVATIATKIRKELKEKIHNYAKKAEIDYQSFCETESMRWNDLCDKTRISNIAKKRVEMARSEHEKAKERMPASKSFENSHVKKTWNPSLSKAVGTMFSIFPDGGEEAMSKLLTSEQIQSVTESNFHDATTKKTKLDSAYQKANIDKLKALEYYKTSAEACRSNYQENGDQFFVLIKVIFSGVIILFQRSRDNRQESILNSSVSLSKDNGKNLLALDTIDWTNRQKKIIGTGNEEIIKKDQMKSKKIGKDIFSEDAFSLIIHLEDSKSINQLSNELLAKAESDMCNNSVVTVHSKDQILSTSPIIEHHNTKNISDAIPMGIKKEERSTELNSLFQSNVKEHISLSINTSVKQTTAKEHEISTTNKKTSATSSPELKTMKRERASTSPIFSQTYKKTLSDVVQKIKKENRNIESPNLVQVDIKENISLPNIKTLVQQDTVEGEKRSYSPTAKMSPSNSPQWKTVNSDADKFFTHFWEDKIVEDDQPPPTIIDSFSCAYWPREDENYMSPLLHGRMYCTSDKMYFTGWSDKKIILDWTDVKGITKETTAMGTVPNALKITFNDVDSESSYFFGSFVFREDALALLNKLVAVARSISLLTGDKEKGKAVTITRVPEDKVLMKMEKILDQKLINTSVERLKGKAVTITQVPADKVLMKMKKILDQKLMNTSVERFYDLCWSEKNESDTSPFYESFLKRQGNMEVDVGLWQYAEDGFDYKWSGEKFKQKRIVNFSYNRTTHLYIGPPVAKVRQTHFCTQNNNKLIVVMSIAFFEIPYADSFTVEIRWIARRDGVDDLHVEVGLFVDFTKYSILGKKIKSSTAVEVTPVHAALFQACKEVCEGADIICNIIDLPCDGTEMIAKKTFYTPASTSLDHTTTLRQMLRISNITRLMNNLLNRLSDRNFFFANMILVIVWLYFSAYRRSLPREVYTTSFREEEQFEELSEKINNLQIEMKEMRIILDRILSDLLNNA